MSADVRGVIFDLDGVLADSMPSHVAAWREAFDRVAGLKVSEYEIYLLEGMRGKELIERVFQAKGIGDDSLSDRVAEEKNRIFRQTKNIGRFEGAKALVESLSCRKAVVSGSSKEDVHSTLAHAGLDHFDLVMTADDVEKGKPDPGSFIEAARRLGLERQDAVVIENAPLGARAANNASIACYIVLNNTPLSRSDFAGLIKRDRIFDSTGSLKAVLPQWCQNK